MLGIIHLHLLILCGIWSQGVIGTFANEEIKESSDFLIRQKRVINCEPSDALIARIEERPYIVHIKRTNRFYCVGSILSNRVVISSAECTEIFPIHEYRVVTKTATTTHKGIIHNVTNIKVHKDNIQDRVLDGVALLTIDPAVVYSLYIQKIDLHVEPILPGTLGTVSGWGYDVGNQVVGSGTNYPRNLRTIQVPIISHRDCVNRYRNYYPINDKDICTFHPQRHCGHSDRGAPLVIDHLLVGIFLRSGPLGYHYNFQFPDVFALLQHTYYSNWIRANI